MDTDNRIGKRRMDGGLIMSQGVILLSSTLKLFLPSIAMISGKGDVMDILSLFDARLLPWVFVLNVFGHYAKKARLPRWIPPMPLLLLLLSFAICTVFGFVHTQAEGFRAAFVAIGEYGVVNGCLCAGIATFGYDTVHSWSKKIREGVRRDG